MQLTPLCVKSLHTLKGLAAQLLRCKSGALATKWRDGDWLKFWSLRWNLSIKVWWALPGLYNGGQLFVPWFASHTHLWNNHIEICGIFTFQIFIYERITVGKFTSESIGACTEGDYVSILWAVCYFAYLTNLSCSGTALFRSLMY